MPAVLFSFILQGKKTTITEKEQNSTTCWFWNIDKWQDWMLNSPVLFLMPPESGSHCSIRLGAAQCESWRIKVNGFDGGQCSLELGSKIDLSYGTSQNAKRMSSSEVRPEENLGILALNFEGLILRFYFCSKKKQTQDTDSRTEKTLKTTKKCRENAEFSANTQAKFGRMKKE